MFVLVFLYSPHYTFNYSGSFGLEQINYILSSRMELSTANFLSICSNMRKDGCKLISTA